MLGAQVVVILGYGETAATTGRGEVRVEERSRGLWHRGPRYKTGTWGTPISFPASAPSILTAFGKLAFFLPRIFLGTASGQFLRPAASRLLLSRFLPKRTGPSHKAPARLRSRGLSLLGAPGKWGKKKEKNSTMSYLIVKWNRSRL